MLRKTWVLLVASLFVALKAGGQSVRVVDAETGQPLALVSITNYQSDSILTTDTNGEVLLSLRSDTDSVLVRLLGYSPEVLTLAELKNLQYLIRLSPSELFLDQVVISATRWKQRRRDVPSKISTITRREVALQNPQTAADLLSISGDVFVQKSQQGGGSPMIRGFAANRLLYAVDGVRMNTAIFRSGNLQNVISLDPFVLERTEVFFGPGSVMYGSDAIGGVMSFQTQTPVFSETDQPSVSGSGTLGFATANKALSTHIDVNVGFDKWASFTSLSSNTFQDLRMGRFGPDDYLRSWYQGRIDDQDVQLSNTDPLVQVASGYDQVNLTQKLRYAPTAELEFNYGFHYSTTTDIPRYDRLIQVRDGLPASAEWRYGPQTWSMHNLQLLHRGKTAIYDEMSIRPAFQYFEESRIDRSWATLLRRTRREQVYAYSLNADFYKQWKSSQKLFYGLELVRNEVRSQGVTEDITSGTFTPAASRYPRSSWASYAIHASYQWRPDADWLFQAGARLNAFDLQADFSDNLAFYPLPFSEADAFNLAWTGSLGLTRDFPGGWDMGLNLSSGFRAPNVDDVGKIFDSEPGRVVVPNPDLEPEYAYNAEVDIAKVWGNTLKVDCSVYYTNLQGAMVRSNATLNGMDSVIYDGALSQVQAVQNAANGYVYGVQAWAELLIAPGLRLYSQYNYQRGEERLSDGTESPLRHAAPWFGVTRLSYTYQGLVAQLSATYSGPVPFDRIPRELENADHLFATDGQGRPYAPSWYSLNLKLGIPLSDKLMLNAGVENLTDQRYRPYSSGIAAPGRNVMASVQARF